jgi:hypothetical protein
MGAWWHLIDCCPVESEVHCVTYRSLPGIIMTRC